MNKHTPGPWNIFINHTCKPDPWDDVKNLVETAIYGKDQVKIAVIETWIGTNQEIECAANAELIAAASELLAALELVKASFSDDSHLRRYPAIWQMVNDTIAKAKGE